MGKFVKRPEIIEAVRVPTQADDTMGWRELSRFLNRVVGPEPPMIDVDGMGGIQSVPGDWIIKTETGFRPCPAAIFNRTYQPHH